MNSEVKKLTGAGATKKRKRAASLDARKARAGWVFVLPFVIGFLIIYLPIIIDSIKYSFHTVKFGSSGLSLQFVGFGNYQRALFEDPEFVQILTAGIQQLIFDIPAIVIFSLFIAVLLNQKMVGRAAFRAIFFIPVIIATGIVDSIDQSNTMLEYMENTEEGINDGSGQNATSEILSVVDIEVLFANMKVGTELVEYVVNMVNNIYNIINRSGVQMLIYLAGLQSISPAIYESCSIDGASAWETFWKITFPMISPMILVNTVYTVIDSFTSQSNQVMTYISEVYNTVTNGNTLSTAMAWLYFLIVILIIGIVAAVLSAYVFYQKRD